MAISDMIRDFLVSPEIESIVDRVPKNIGAGGYDAWGFNRETMKKGFALVKWLHDEYFRVETYGIENVPADGRVLLIANHAGQLPLDGVMMGAAVALREENPRFCRAMIERFFPTIPYLGNLMNGVGAVVGDPVNCEKMLEREEAIIVFPEGIRGSGKPYEKRYQLQRFGTGFMHLAINHKTPIIPVGVVGSEETMPSVGNLKPLAKMLGVPYIPIGPLLPLPAKMIINFGEPMYFDGDVESEAEVTQKVEQVKEAIAALISKGLTQRESVFQP